jgi:uncharacterized membrane protein
MSTFFLKSILSVILLLLAAVGMFTMFEMFGRDEKRFNAARLRTVHKTAGVFYLIVFALITYFCLRFVFITKAELSARAALHGIFAAAVLVLLAVKVLYVRVYRQFYEQVKVFGLIISLITFVMVGMSAGYYFLVSEFGADTSYDRIIEYKEQIALERKTKKVEAPGRPVRTDPESIGRGKNIFDAKCRFCHNAYSTETIVGPGLKGVLKNPELPVSRRPATPENIRGQLRQPFSRMPSFDYLTEEEVEDIVAFLNTL